MSKKLFSFMIGELKVLRLLCKSEKCGAIAEIPIGRLGKRMCCPACGSEFDSSLNSSGKGSPLGMLGQAMRALADADDIDVEFVLPVKE